MWTWIKLPKALALIAFFLPWMTVSCSGQKLVSASGVGLAFGRYTSDIAASHAARTTTQQIDGWVLAALLLLVLGLALSFARQSRRTAAIVAVTSALAAVFAWAGTLRFSERRIADEIARDHPGERIDATQALQVIRIDWHIGYWLCLAALVIAAVMAALVATGRDLSVTRAPRAR